MNDRWKVGGVAAFALVMGLGIGWLTAGHGVREPSPEAVAAESPAAQVWTCSMHPHIRMPAPGQCPICGMDLIPVASGGEELAPRQIRLSEAARELARVRVAPVQRQFVTTKVRLLGIVAVDETRRRTVAARVAGRIDRLYVDYAGMQVQEGFHMASLYSPELLAAQEELLQAVAAVQPDGHQTPPLEESTRRTLESARDRLRLWGLQPEQVAAIEQRRRPADHLTLYAPLTGTVLAKHVDEGSYVQTGTPIYTVADLSHVWIQLQAYESDMPWLRYGQQVRFELEAFPGETLSGRIAFIDPVLDEATRTVRVRVNVSNPDGRLKPGMFARANVRAQVTASGRIMDPDLSGRWISPMHPEIVKDGPGLCDVCGMPLVRAEDLGYVSATADNAPLVIPASAPLVTGRRAVVYVAVPGDPGVYEGREVELGPRAGDHYLVLGGLREGEEVVVNGAFRIDSAMQIRARPSMMSPRGDSTQPTHNHDGTAPMAAMPGAPATTPSHAEHAPDVAPASAAQLAPLFAAYLDVQQALSRDDLEGSRRAARGVTAALGAVDMGLLDGSAHGVWMPAASAVRTGANHIAAATGLQAARAAFDTVSTSLIEVARHLGTGMPAPLHRFHCPMAFDSRGASWLQEAAKTENPYFGSRMYRCGDLEETFPAPSGAR